MIRPPLTHRLLATATLCAVLCAPWVNGLAAADCPAIDDALSSLSASKGLYVRHQHEKIIELLDPLLSPSACLGDNKTNIEGHLLLGVAKFQVGDLDGSADEFLALLRLDPDYRIDDSIDLPAPALAYIERVRRDNAEELDELRTLLGGGTGIKVETVYVTVIEEQRQLWINFLPFGAGQFQNQDYEWGIAMAAGQGVALGLSALGAFMVELIRGPTATFTPQEAELAESWQIVQLVGAGSFAVLYGISIWHALANFEARTTTALPPTRKKPNTLTPTDDPEVQWGIAPTAGVDGGGIALTVRW